ncbi:DUF4082 domain-containing protein, partial [Bradyrhizobium sp. Arg237L]|uniref:DUF4082 domain-containing protein n=1 Tax=Bradyrhizobium sp. Arg237L TaxID=3003352 RepID=UPI00249F7551
MLTQKPSALSVKAQPLLSAETNYTLHDLTVTVAGLPTAGAVLKADRFTRVTVGDTLTAAELAALSFAPTPLLSGDVSPWNGVVIYVPQDGGRLPIPLLADLPAGLTGDTPVALTELPSNGSVFLADGTTAVARGHIITASQLCGLTFSPAADAVGQISLLRYCSADHGFMGEVLLIVGPGTPTASPTEADTADGSNSVAPLALALLLETGLSSLNSTQASAAVDPNDVLPPDSSAPSGPSAGLAGQVFDQAAVPVPSDIVGAAPAILAQSATTDTTGSTGTNASPSDQTRHHRIGSSTPPDSGSLTLRPLPSSDLLKTTLPNPLTTTTTSASTLNSPAPITTSLLNRELMMGPTLLATTLANGPSSTTTHWTNSGGGSWNVAANWGAGVPGLADKVVMDATGAYTVTSTSNVDINSLVVGTGVTLSCNPGTLFTVEGSVVDNGIIQAGPFNGNQISNVDIKGNISGTGSLDVSNQAVLEIGGAVSGQLTNGSFSGITVSFDVGNGEIVLDHSAQFHGLIASSSPGAPLSANQFIDLKDLAFTSSMSTSVQYDITSNTSTVNFSNGSTTVSLLFAGKDPNWTLNSDGHGGTVVADPSGTNPIVLENELPGTPMSVWQVAPGADSTKLEGFTTAISTNIGSTVQFKIDNLTGSPNYQIQIYRLGYYGGDGARLVTTLQHQGTSSIAQPSPITNAATGEVDAGNWSVTDSWSIPTTAVSGVYVANVVQGTQVFQIPFVVKDPNSTSDIVFQTSDETWQAYNGWGGASLYGGNGPSQGGAAYAVSYNRPIMTRDGVGLYANSDDTVFAGEYPAIYWLEENGYNVSYISGMDTATNGALLLNHKVFMDAGHDEYWTDSQVANVQAAANAGVNLVFLSGNEIFWQTQFTPSIDSSKTANRTLVTYKDSHFEQLINPSGQGTGTFEAPTNWGGAAMPSNALTGTVFSVDESGSLGTIKIPYSMTQLRFWRNTSVAATAPGQTASLESGLLGYEWDSSPDNGFMPAGLIDLSSTTLQQSSAFNTEFGNVDTSGTATHNLVEYRDPTSGALVFGAGTVFWSWGLSNQHDPSPDGNQTNTDPNVQQAMVNVFADMGIQPQTLQASLVIASQSTDHTAPTSKITNVSSSSVIEGQTVTVSGTATDVGGVIGGVQISTDGGKTWHVTSGQIGTQTVNWTYTFNAPAKGSYSIETRAVDDSLNLETPGSGVSYTVSPSTSLNLFGSSATPATADVSDPKGVEVGLKFTSSTNGQITGIRFYKGSLNTGAHLVDLWSAGGTLLATATSTNETASGWQQVNFSSPVNIVAGTTYVASYHMTNGQYSDTPYYFDTLQNPTNGSLSATADGLNGVYAYSSGSIFPTNIPVSGDNYWVDVVLNDTGSTTETPPVLVTQTPNQNAVVGSAFSLTLAGTFNDPDGGALTYSATGSNGAALPSWLTFNAATRTFSGTPTSANVGTAGVQVSATDPAGLSASETFNIAVTTTSATVSLFTASNIPTQTSLNDGSPLEVGVKFTSSTAGQITALKFYRSPGDTGSDLLDLWTSTGTKLASATFTNTTASGWQTVTLATPVSIAANTTYVASYHTNGAYAATSNFFTNAVSSGALTAPSSASSGGNGVYSYGGTSTAGIFPTSSFSASNYYADVVFSPGSTTDTPPVLVTQTPNQSAVAGSAFSLTLSAGTFNDPDGGALTYSATGSNGAALPAWLTFSAATRTFSGTPTSANVGTAGVQVS